MQGPGVQLINGISGIFGNLGSVILGIPPNTPSPGPTSPPPAPAGCPVDGCPAEGDEEGTCISTCEDWPYSQCRVELRRPDGSWQAATCLNPYTTKPGPFNPFPQKFTNYPEWVLLLDDCYISLFLSQVWPDPHWLQEMRRRVCMEGRKSWTQRLLRGLKMLSVFFLAYSTYKLSCPLIDVVNHVDHIWGPYLIWAFRQPT